jgi:hypothetical protein
MRLSGESGCFTHRTAHYKCAVGLPNDLKAMALIEPESRIILEHEQCHRFCRRGLFVQQPYDL